jgi:hypothetical protein
MLAGSLLLVGKFILDSDVAVYGVVALLVAASVWNAWPKIGRVDHETQD